MFRLCYDHQAGKKPHFVCPGAYRPLEDILFVLAPGGVLEDGCISNRLVSGWRGGSKSVLCDLCMLLSLSGKSLAITGSNQAYRAISTGQLNALLRLHLRPIDVVVYHGPQGYLVLRGASRLDAFSGYPVRT